MDVAGLAVAVHAHSPELRAALERWLARHVVAGVEPRVHYGLVLGSGGDGRRGFHELYWGSVPVLRTLDGQRLARALLGHLWAHARASAEDRYLLVSGVAAVAGDRAVVMPGAPLCDPSLERRLQREDVAVVDAPWFALDLGSAELVVADPEVDAGLRLHWVALEALGSPRSGGVARAVAPGRYPLAGWALPGDGEPASRARIVVRAAAHGLNRPAFAGPPMLTRLALAVAGRPFRALPTASPAAAADALAGLLAPRSGGR